VPFPLIVQPDGGEPRVFAGQFVIGKRGDLVVADPYASPLHAVCYPDGSNWVIQDLGSTNWTMVNGERAWAARVLAKGDRVTIGRTVLTVVPAG
jgi:pSer/pThr/pTyr-binding forkhead associated (FHA) protein